MDDILETVVDISRPIVIVYNFIIMILFIVHLSMSTTKMTFLRVIASFYIVDYIFIILIELIVYVIRGLLAFIGVIKRHFWLMLLACPLTAMAVAYEILMAKAFLTSQRYNGYKPDLISIFTRNTTAYFKIEERWQCCGLVAPTDYPEDLIVQNPYCCPSLTACDYKRAYPVGCWVMQKYMIVAGVVVIILAVLDFLSFISLLLLARAAKNEDEDEDY